MAFMALVVWGGTAGAALAQQGKPDYDKARQHYTMAQQALGTGDYDIAAREFGRAYEITKDPILFFKIGLAHESAGNCEAAVIYFGRYLKEANPSAQDAAATQDRIELCKQKLGAPAVGEAKPAGTTPPPPPTVSAPATDDSAAGELDDAPIAALPSGPDFLDDEPSGVKTAAWISLGVAIAAATTGGVLGLSASSREEDLDTLLGFRDPTTGLPRAYEGEVRKQYEDLDDEGQRFETIASAAWGVAGAALATSVVLFVVDGAGTADGVAMTPRISADSVSFAASWEF
jgi:hypothetical protein